ncbi:SP_1767 family glycosyltransferase [Clostridium perfringens]|uniref:SP_1767 family glycosyltransferase n=3 Tax=Clostridium perfringens TaxID=1502 RepID=UPI001ABAE32C|nr:SP_1767 family glycosyltransferase [Clostridium perfringens]MBO3395350.1 SP_1767 family glycosyltransferase [Clostridium perfringens]MBO3401852.1 SP_1767 family glycosyltransferase [Clostridium perfringens]
MNLIKKIYANYLKKNYITKKIIYSIFKSLNKLNKNRIVVKDCDEIIEKILKEKYSLSRFGDGELRLICGKDISFQKYNKNLSDRLKEILISQTNDKKILIAIPNVFDTLDIYVDKSKEYWTEQLFFYKDKWISLLNENAEYYDAFISRPYMIYRNKNNCKYKFKKIKEIWKEKKIVIIEGEKSKLGVGNDLFKSCKSIERIICPSKDAFSKYNEIFEVARKIPKDKIILIALGPTASILAYDLSNIGLQAIDIGHIDIEYEWFLNNSIEKESIKGKYTNEAELEFYGNLNDENYEKEIISVI